MGTKGLGMPVEKLKVFLRKKKPPKTATCETCKNRKRKLQVQTEAAEWFKGPFCILDTETTGLDENAQIIEIAVIDEEGKTLLDTLVKPPCSIPAESTAIHGLSDNDVENAPLFDEVYPQLLEATKERKIIIYNSEYDNRLIKQSLKTKDNLQSFSQLMEQSDYCLMNLFARFYGQKNDSGNFRWKSLSFAADFFDVPVIGAHRALADCLMTLGVLKNLATLETYS